jgi:UDP-N-acetylglucosamine 2-epimerase (non-hydrolysing)
MGNRTKPRKIVSIAGTRPEIIKMAPVVEKLKARGSIFEHVLVTTAQHRGMLDQALSAFNLIPDIDLNLMQPDQSLAGFASNSLAAISNLLSELKPDAVLIQGDTTTTMTAALAAFYLDVRVGHIEAGLRTRDRRNPFPEEINRRITTCIADINFAPTERARLNLLGEGVPEDTIFLTGNTIVDALKSIPLEGNFSEERLNQIDFDTRRVLLVTAHRRENHGKPLQSICQAIRLIAKKFRDVEIVYPVHLNPNVRDMVREELKDLSGIHLIDPVTYIDMLKLMKHSYFVMTDSGGLQEEAISFNKPVLVLREVTERPELIEIGAGKIVGTDVRKIVDETSRLLTDEDEYKKMSGFENPFGDGRAAERIVGILEKHI